MLDLMTINNLFYIIGGIAIGYFLSDTLFAIYLVWKRYQYRKAGNQLAVDILTELAEKQTVNFIERVTEKK